MGSDPVHFVLSLEPTVSILLSRKTITADNFLPMLTVMLFFLISKYQPIPSVPRELGPSYYYKVNDKHDTSKKDNNNWCEQVLPVTLGLTI